MSTSGARSETVRRKDGDLLIPFARRRSDGRMIDALTAKSGLACECDCPGCNQQVIARHCTEKISHFAHAVSAACEGALESSLHAAAKQAIIELGFVWLPRSEAREPWRFVFARAETEKARDDIRPDLTLFTRGGKPLAVEVCVTHEVDDAKEEYVRSRKLACVEYWLDEVPRDLAYAELKRRFEENEVWGNWVYNEKDEAAREQREKEEAKWRKREEEREKVEERRQRAELEAWLKSPHAKPREMAIHRIEQHGYIHNCPIRRRGTLEDYKGLAFADLDCPRCPFCTAKTDALVQCIGHFPKLALADDEIVHRFGGNITKRRPNYPSASNDEIASNDNPF